MASVTVNLKKNQYDMLTEIADRKYKGNFSKALRMELKNPDSDVLKVIDSGITVK